MDLARLVQQKNQLEADIAKIVGRPALIGHVGEFIAARIFGIALHQSATNAGSDGHFASGDLKGRTVNVKWYGKHEGLLDISLKATPDFYLVLTGPKGAAASSRGGTRPWLIRHVFLFESSALHRSLATRGVKVGTATSVTLAEWSASEIYPTNNAKRLAPQAGQLEALRLFG
jgi:hypothetical protein